MKDTENHSMPTDSCQDKPLISVVSCCYNESDVIERFYRILKDVLQSIPSIRYEIILVDDGSTDDTLAKLRSIVAVDPQLRVLVLSRNFGHQVALTAGLEAAVGQAVIMMDSDLQHPPEFIPALVGKWQEGFDVVSTIRDSTEKATFFKNITSRLFYQIINLLSDIPIPNGVSDFCLLSRRAQYALLRMPEKHRFLRGMVSWLGMNRTFIHFTSPPRAAGTSKYSFFKMFSLAMHALFSFSTFPLRIAGYVGFIVSGLGFGYLLWILLRFFLLNDLVSGWGSLICVTLILGGSQLIFIGFIGQYVSRIFEEVKNRPLYVLREEISNTSQSENRLQSDGTNI